MPENLALYALLVFAVAVGFLLGRRQRRRRGEQPGSGVEDYIQGLNHLLNERHDLAIDTFIERMAVDGGTVDTHLALGSLVRRRGETERAIRIHQNLLDRPSLSHRHRRQCELELARDYLAAGLLDRAENLLLELTEQNSEHEQIARELLLEIYQREKDWSKACATGRELSRGDHAMRSQVAQFECERAQQLIDAEEPAEARAALKRAERLDSQCARVHLLRARLDMREGRYQDTCRALRTACELDHGLVVPSLELFEQACQALGRESDYLSFLQEGLERSCDLAVLDRLASDIEARDGLEAAIEFRVRQLEVRPSIGGCVHLFNQLEAAGKVLEPRQLQPILRFARALLQRQSHYRCSNCGFGSKTLMWQCPSCRQWSVMKPTDALDLS